MPGGNGEAQLDQINTVRESNKYLFGSQTYHEDDPTKIWING